MAWSFADSFDLYAAFADAYAGFWDSGAGTPTLVAGRFTGSQALNISATTATLTKSSGVNDAVHHLVVSYRQTAALSGTTLGAYFELLDGATAQCSIVFRSDGAILLTSGGPAGTALATYTGAVAAANTWYAFEFEVVINNTTGSFAVRKNGNTVNDFSASSLNTRPTSTNNYANKLTVGMQAAVNAQQIDDFFWQSGAATGSWLGDIRCYTRMPASDAQAQFSRSPAQVTPFGPSTPGSFAANAATYTPFTAKYSGALGAMAVSVNAAATANVKGAIYDNTGASGQPGAVLATSNVLANPVVGNNTLTFPSPPSVINGSTYYLALDQDASVTCNRNGGQSGCYAGATTYASFPGASPGGLSGNANNPVVSAIITAGANANCVGEPQEDGLNSYVYDSNPGDADFYGIGSIASTPATVIATTIRGYMQKSDAGTRTAAVQLKSGAATVATPTLTLSSSGWLWAWRMDLTDPNTGLAWTPGAVNNTQIGPAVVA